MNMKSTYKPFLTVALASASALPVLAQAESEEAGEQINAAFHQIATEDLMGGYSTVNVEQLMKKNNISITNALENLQGEVSGWNGAGMWGNTADILYLIDGVPRDRNNIKPEEIQDITFMKGAQAVVLYGSRAAKGAVLITTKRGKAEDLSINVKANTGWNVAKVYPEYLHSAEYMTLYNEALANDGKSAKYSPVEIYNHASGENPYRYPDVNFYSSDYLKKAYNHTDVVAEISGGNRVAKFYSNVSYYRFGDFMDFGEAANDYTDRFDVRGNVDLRLSDYVTGFVNATATYYNRNTAVTSTDGYWAEATTFRPNRLSPFVPLSAVDPNAQEAYAAVNGSSNIIDGMFLGADESNKTNIFADYYAAGKSTWTSRQFQFDAGVNIDLQKVLKGLSFHTQISIDYATSYSTSYNNDYATFNPAWSNANGKGAIIGITQYNEDKKSGTQNIGGSTSNQTIAFNAHFDYKRTFNEDHNVNALLLANGYTQTYSGQYHRTANANLGLDVAYNYQHKYYAEAALALVHSARLPENGRQGLSQSYTIGWNLAKENFLQDKGIDYLKLSASYSDVKTDLGIDYYEYKAYYTTGGWWDWGHGGVDAFYPEHGGNESLTFIDRKEMSVNLQGSFLNKSLWFDASWFTTALEGQLIDANSSVPVYFKTYYPDANFASRINYNNDKRTGFDVSVNYKKEVGDWGFQAGVNATYYTTEATRRDDSLIADEYQHREGKMLDGIWGYECLGFFKDEADIANSPTQSLGDSPRVGDLKYKDQNGDGVIDTKDQVELARGGWYGAPLTLGLNLTAKYKGFSLYVLATGGFGGHGTKSNSYWWSGAGENKYTAAVRDRVIIKDGAITNYETAKYPALTTNSGSNNFQTSDFWIYKTDRFDLAKVQLTYDFNDDLFTDNKYVKGLSLFAAGSNLLTIAPEKEILEMNVGSAPQSRFYNIGVKVQF